MSFELYLSDNKLYVSGGMSTEIVFAKYVASKRNLVYSGWDVRIRMCYPNIILDDLNYVCSTVKQLENRACKKNVIIGTGFLSMPYIVDLCNLVYLPSQFLIGVRSLIDLDSMLKVLKDNGIDAYAIVGYDECMSDCLVAWIKFKSIPRQYEELIKSYLESDLTVLAGIYSNIPTGECVIYNYDKKDIYFLHIRACYGEDIKKDFQKFVSMIVDFSMTKLIQEKTNIMDWESGFDFIHTYLPNSFNKKLLISHETKELYKIATYLGDEFMRLNNIKKKGVVLNHYPISNPIYEVNYGYIPYCFWKLSWEDINNIVSHVDEDSELWINDTTGGSKTLFDSCMIKKIHFGYDTPLCNELSNFIYNHKPKQYPSFNYVDIRKII